MKSRRKPFTRLALIEVLRSDNFAAAVERAPAHLVAKLGRAMVRVVSPHMPARPRLRDSELEQFGDCDLPPLDLADLQGIDLAAAEVIFPP